MNSADEPTFVERMLLLHKRLKEAAVPHAFGGALALAWCIEEARGTQDIDLNVFVDATEFESVLPVFPPGVAVSERNLSELRRDGQSRLWWGDIPVDVFFNTTPFHAAAARRIRWEEFVGVDMPFLDCNDLAVFKAFFNRSKDWLDLAVMLHDGTIDANEVADIVAEHLGEDDERVPRLRHLTPESWS